MGQNCENILADSGLHPWLWCIASQVPNRRFFLTASLNPTPSRLSAIAANEGGLAAALAPALVSSSGPLPPSHRWSRPSPSISASFCHFFFPPSCRQDDDFHLQLWAGGCSCHVRLAPRSASKEKISASFSWLMWRTSVTSVETETEPIFSVDLIIDELFFQQSFGHHLQEAEFSNNQKTEPTDWFGSI